MGKNHLKRSLTLESNRMKVRKCLNMTTPAVQEGSTLSEVGAEHIFHGRK